MAIGTSSDHKTNEKVQEIKFSEKNQTTESNNILMTAPWHVFSFIQIVQFLGINEMGLDVRKPVFGCLRTTNAQTAYASAQSNQHLCYLQYPNLLQAKFQFFS